MKTRRAFESGHRPKVLVVVDHSPEFAVALRYAGRRAIRLGITVIGIAVVEPQETLPFLGIGKRMQEEAEADAREMLESAARTLQELSGTTMETVVRTGRPAEEIARLVAEDEDIAGLILASSSGESGPGPLVSAIASGGANFKVPITIIPGHLSRAEIDALA